MAWCSSQFKGLSVCPLHMGSWGFLTARQPRGTSAIYVVAGIPQQKGPPTYQTEVCGIFKTYPWKSYSISSGQGSHKGPNSRGGDTYPTSTFKTCLSHRVRRGCGIGDVAVIILGKYNVPHIVLKFSIINSGLISERFLEGLILQWNQSLKTTIPLTVLA